MRLATPTRTRDAEPGRTWHDRLGRTDRQP